MGFSCGAAGWNGGRELRAFTGRSCGQGGVGRGFHDLQNAAPSSCGGEWRILDGCTEGAASRPRKPAPVSLWLRKGWKVPRNLPGGGRCICGGRSVHPPGAAHAYHLFSVCSAAWIRGWGSEEADANISFWGGHVARGQCSEPCPLSLQLLGFAGRGGVKLGDYVLVP